MVSLTLMVATSELHVVFILVNVDKETEFLVAQRGVASLNNQIKTV